MHSYCIACEQRYIYRDGDEDCTKFVCSWCIATSPEKMMNKWVRLRFKILNRDGFTCKYCGKSPMNKTDIRLHIDHIKPQSEYGTNSESNLITACNECNFGKLDFELTEKAKEKVDEYLEEANKRLGEPYKGLEVVGDDKVGDSKIVVRVVADSQYVGEGDLFSEPRKNDKAKVSYSREEYNLTCQLCNGSFKSKIIPRKFCSKKCRNDYFRISRCTVKK